MDSELSERIVLEIVTNLKTRFVVIPLRSETVGDVRGTIKSYHMKLFPSWGVVDVNALEVEVTGNKCRIADPLSIEHLFWRASRAAIFAELIPLRSNTLVNTPRPNLAGATEPSIVSGQELRQNPAERTPSPQRRGLAEGRLTPDPGASSYSDLQKLGLDRKVGRHGYGCKSEVVEGQLRKMKRGIDELESPFDAGERQVPAECALVDVREPATKKSCVDRGPPVLEHIEPEARVPTDKHSVKKSILVVESTTRFASCVPPDNGEQLQFRKLSLPEFFHQSGPPLTKKGQEIASSSQDGSRSRSETDYPVAENLPAEPGLGSFKPTEDSVRKTLKDLGTKHNSSSSDMSDSDSQSRHPLIDELEEEPGLAISNPDREDIERNLSAAEASPESSSSQSGTQTGSQNEIACGKQASKVEVDGLSTPKRRVPSGDLQNLNGSLEINKKSRHSKRHESDMSTGSSSGGSSDKTTGQNVDSGDKGAELQGNQGKHNSSSSNANSAESDGEEGSKSVRPKEGSVGNDSDQTTSDGDSSPQSSEGSESENIESSSDGSDESDQMPQTGRNMDFTTPKEGTGAARSIGRRRFGASVDPKYQHLLDSQNGFDELISLSQLKSKVISGFQHESHVPLADDSLSIDLVPDTQGGELNGTSVIPEVRKDLITAEPVESNIKDTKLSTQESSTVRISVIQIEEKRAESVQDGGEDGDRLQRTSGPLTSVKLGEASLLLSVKEELFSSGGGVTEKALELDEEPLPQARTEDSQQVCAALQLARMSVPNTVDANLETPRKRMKKRISSPAEATPETNFKKLSDSSQQRESPISVLGDLFHEGRDQRLEANRLLTPDKNMPVAECLGNVLPALEANDVITKPGSTAGEIQAGTLLNEEGASDADVGRKKQRKRSRKVSSNTEVPEMVFTGHVKTVEDEPSHGHVDRPDNASNEAGDKENSGKTPSFEYRDLRKRSNLAIDHDAVQKIMLGLKRDNGPKSVKRNASKAAEEDQAGLQKQQRLTGWVCTLCNPSVPFARQAALIGHIQKAHSLLESVPIERETDGKKEAENSIRSKKKIKGKKGRDLNQNADGDPSASLPQEVDVVSDRLQVQDTEEEEMKGEEEGLVLEEKHNNVGEEDEADEESPVVLNQEKKSKKVGQSSKSAKKARDMETPLLTDEDQEMHSTFAEKTKRRRDKLKVPKKQSEAEVAEEIEQLDNPTCLGTNDEQPTDKSESGRRNPNETRLKKKRKKAKNLDPSVEGRNSEGELLEGHQVEPVDDEDQIATQQSQKVVTNAYQNDIVGEAAKKKSRKKKLQEKVSLHEEAGVSLHEEEVGVSLQTKKVTDAKISDKMVINSKSKEWSKGNTGRSNKRKANGQIQADQNNPKNPEHCPHGCGKEFLKKTSAYYRHQKSCVLGRTPYFG